IDRAQGSPQFEAHLIGGGGLGRGGGLAVLRRSGTVFAFCVLSAVSSFAQSSPSPSPSTPPMPLRGFVPPYEILRTLRAAGFRTAGATFARGHDLRRACARFSRRPHAGRRGCPLRRHPRRQSHRCRSRTLRPLYARPLRAGVLWPARTTALSAS